MFSLKPVETGVDNNEASGFIQRFSLGGLALRCFGAAMPFKWAT